MRTYQRDFIRFCIERKVLRFGNFTLKSGRQAPYFFNAGLFNTGSALDLAGEAYRQTLQLSGAEFDVIFGPAYKGIALACATAIAFHRAGREVPWCYNRKETKDHGEGGILIGSPLKGKRVALVDDVITSGTAIDNVVPLIEAAGGHVSVICVALDRREISRESPYSALQTIAGKYNVPAVSTLSLDDILLWLENDPEFTTFAGAIKEYRARYGV